MNTNASVSNYLSHFPVLSGSYEPFITTLAFSLLVTFLFYVTLSYVLRPIFRNRDNSLAIVLLNVSQNPLVTIIILLGIKLAFKELNTSLAIEWIERGLTASIVVILTLMASQLSTQVVTYSLRDYAKQTEAVWDDVLVPIVERVLPALTYILGTFLFLESLGIDLTGIWVAFGGLTFVLSFALRDILANFFSGLVLLIDTPFQYGDVIVMSDGSMAVIKNIGLRVTRLYMIDRDCEIYIPNATLGNQNIINITRPTSNHPSTIEVDVKGDADQDLASRILRQAVLGHPDTLGHPDEKLQYLDDYDGLKEVESDNLSKKEAGKLRLLAEQKVNQKMEIIERKFRLLIQAIQVLEKAGLDEKQIQIMQNSYQEILELVGLDLANDNRENLKKVLLESNSTNHPDNLISEIINLYRAWLKDPNLNTEDERNLLDECETKISILKNKVNKLHQKIGKPGSYETRLDDYALNLVEWLREEFQSATTVWKKPTISLSSLDSDSMQFTIKFYVDNIKLENWSRGERIANEVRREMVRRLQEANIYKK